MIQKFLISPNNTIEEALQLIQKNSRRCLVVVDRKKKLLGTLSDGDIRGALLKNKKLKDKIFPFYNKKAKYRRVFGAMRNIGIKATFKKIFSHFYSKIAKYS